MKKTAVISLLGCIAMLTASCQKTNHSVTLITLDPGHFHAALVQKSMVEQINPNVYVYAPDNQDVKDHIGRIEGYNTRKDNPTAWREHLYTGPDYLDKLLAEKKGNVVVLAGNNRQKTDYIKACTNAGFNVLSDKPMCIDAKGFETLKAAFDSAQKNNVLLYDIMTERYEITTILQKELAHSPEIFGQLKPGTAQDPSIVKESIHHFCKLVSGNPLKRPTWYYDTTQQGEGIVDVTTHLVDLAMWEAFPEQVIDYNKDIDIISSSRWPTIITKEQYCKSTQAVDFPDYLKSKLDDSGKLPCYANGEINYTLRGIHTKISVTWNFEPPAGGGDTHYSIMKGDKTSILILQGAAQKYKPELYIEPAEGLTLDQIRGAVFNTIIKLQTKYPGIMAMQENGRIKIAVPESYRVGHEAHFTQVTEKYLKFLAEGKLPEWEIPNMLAKYYTTTQALATAKTLPAAATADMPAKKNITFGVCTALTNADLLKKSGYDYLEEGVQKFLIPQEPDEKFAEKLAAARTAGLPIYACNGFLPGSLKVTGTESKHDEILKYADTAFRRAQQAGVKRIVFGSGAARNIPEGFDKQQARGQFVDLLKKIGPIAAQYDVIVVIEPLRSQECNLVNTVAEATAIAKEVNCSNILVLADFYHMAQENESPESIIAAGKLLQHCHIAEKEKRTAPGLAGDDFTPYFKALKQIGYKGGISIEGSLGDNFAINLSTAIKTMHSQMAQ